MVDVPAQYQLYVNNAANQLGISPDIVAAQIYTESGWNPNAQSGAGAEGIAQFEPGTFAAYGSGSPYNVADAFHAYANYMNELMIEEHGNVRDALAAYNAGPGNKSAGYPYADGILKLAGTGITSNPGGTVNATPTGLNPLTWPSGIIAFFDTISSGIFWLRVFMIAGGTFLALLALNQITQIVQRTSKLAKTTAPVAKKVMPAAKVVTAVAQKTTPTAKKTVVAKKTTPIAKKTVSAEGTLKKVVK